MSPATLYFEDLQLSSELDHLIYLFTIAIFPSGSFEIATTTGYTLYPLSLNPIEEQLYYFSIITQQFLLSNSSVFSMS